MYKLIGADGREYGPVSDDQLRQWIAEGRANAQTQAQAEGTTEWKPLSQFPDLFQALGAGAPPTGIQPAAISTAQVSANILERDYEVDIGGCISRAWELLKNNLWMLVGATVLIFVAQSAMGSIPFLGFIASTILGGVLTGGLYWLYLKCIRGQPTSIGDAFAGFTRAFVNLMLAQVVVTLLTSIAILPGAVLLGLGLFPLARDSSPNSVLLTLGIILLIIGFPIVVYLGVAWIFTLPLVVDKKMGFWEAMELSRKMANKHWWGLFGLLFVAGLIGMIGVIGCIIGVIFTIPISIGALMYAYEDIFGGRS